MQLLYLDSYYFYAPIPRALELRKVLGNARGYTLLYTPFSSPRHFLKALTRIVMGTEITSLVGIQSLASRSRAVGSPLRRFAEKLLNALFIGRAHAITIDLESACRVVNEEHLAVIEFLAFVLRHGDRARELLDRGVCSKGTKLRIDADTARELRNLMHPERLAELVCRHASLYTMYEKYSLCRVCRLLGINYPRNVVELKQCADMNQAQELLRECPQCLDPCGGGAHRDDLLKAASIELYARRNYGAKILIATITTISRKNIVECFSCLARCLESRNRNI